MQKRQFTVYGIVQGVGFRYFTWREAKKIGVTGNVRNLADGSVLVIAVGNEAQLAQLRGWLHKGPPGSQVSEIVEQDYSGEINFSGFTIEHF